MDQKLIIEDDEVNAQRWHVRGITIDPKRLVGQYYIPLLSDDDLLQLFPGQDTVDFLNNEKTGSVELSMFRSCRMMCTEGIETSSGKMLGQMRLRRFLVKFFSSESMWYVIASQIVINRFSGAAKNFLVAVATLREVEDKAKILVRGSKSTSFGGFWWEYVYSVINKNAKGKIEVWKYDQAEKNKTTTFKLSNITVKEVTVQGFYDGNGEGFTHLIDDAYEPGVGLVQIVPVCGVYSLKSRKDLSDNGILFAHNTETRIFVPPLHPKKFFDCTCKNCVYASKVTVEYESAVYVRDILEAWEGGIHPTKVTSDLREKLNLMKNISAKPQVELDTPALVRAAISLTDTFPMKAVASRTVALSESFRLRASHYTHGRGFTEMEAEGEVYPDFEGKKCVFRGCDPSILQRTNIRLMNPRTEDIPDYSFAVGIDAFTASADAERIVSKGVESFPGWKEEKAITISGHVWQVFCREPFIVPPPGKYTERDSESVSFFRDVFSLGPHFSILWDGKMVKESGDNTVKQLLNLRICHRKDPTSFLTQLKGELSYKDIKKRCVAEGYDPPSISALRAFAIVEKRGEQFVWKFRKR